LQLKINDRITFALDAYDVLNKSGTVGGDLRIGFEGWITENLALRIGGYHFNNPDYRAITGGFGIRFKGWEIDYGVMYFDASGNAVHMLGITYKF